MEEPLWPACRLAKLYVSSQDHVQTFSFYLAHWEELLGDDMDINCTEQENDSDRLDRWEDIEGNNAGLYTLPPGEEGLYHSHAGGEMVFQQIMDSIEPWYVIHTVAFSIIYIYIIRKRGDPHKCKDHIQQCINSWCKELAWLVDAYLAWNTDTQGDTKFDCQLQHWRFPCSRSDMGDYGPWFPLCMAYFVLEIMQN